MADEALQAALGGFNVTPAETYWGVGAGALGKSLPLLIDPVYGDRGTNIGIALGGALLQGLLGYQAKKEAAEQSLEGAKLANSLIALQTPEERVSLIEQSPRTFTEPLTKLSTALTLQQVADKQRQAQKLADLTTAAEFDLGDLGTKIFEREKKRELEKALALAALSRQPTRGSQQLPTGVQDKIVNESVFVDSAKIHRDKIAEMSPAELKTLLTTGSSMFGLVGSPGFNAENEAILQLYRKANFGATLTGQEKKAADIITGKTLTASKADVLAAWDTLIDQSKRRAQKTMEIATATPESLRESLSTKQPDKMQILQNLQAQLAELKKQKAAAGK
jgi:hypothetical protein